MQSLEVIPGRAISARLLERAEPVDADGDVLVQTLALGICGTDREIAAGDYGGAPPGEQTLVLGHESLGRVLKVPAGSALLEGDLVVGIVRRPDPIPCPNCAVGEWDMCRNGLYTECGIKERHGFGRERFRISSDYLVKVEPHLQQTGVLLEPASILAKAWEHIEYIGRRSHWQPTRALITGAGPVGLLAALMAKQLGFQVDVYDRVVEGPKPQLVRDLGARYHTQGIDEISRLADVIVECTGHGPLVFDCMQHSPPGGIVCLTGISTAGRKLEIDPGRFNQSIVLENDVIFGSVNANRRHYQRAATALAQADQSWLTRLITKRLPVTAWAEALRPDTSSVKTVIDFTLS